MENKSKYLSKNLILFSISSFGPKILSFFMVPLYTNCLTTSEYGTGEIITTTASLVMPILILCIYDAVLRFCFDPQYTNDEILSSGIYVFFRGFLICLAATMLIANLPFVSISSSYLVAFVFLFFANGLYNILTNYARGSEQVSIMVEMSVLTTFSSCMLNIILLLVLNRGLDGYLLANYLGTFVAIFWGIIRLKLWRHVKNKFIHKRAIADMQHYSTPLVFNKIGWWINSVSDRYIVTWMLGSDANGVYTVAYKIPTILTACSDIFSQAWQLSAIKEFDPEDTDHFVLNMYKLYNALLVIICSGLILFNIPLAKILFAKDFFVAWEFVPPLLISFVFGGLSGFFGSIFSAVKDTKIFTVSSLVGAAANVILNFILIAVMNCAMGAAIATMLSNIVIWMIRFYRVRKHIKIDIPIVKHMIMYFLLLIQFLVSLSGIVWWSVIIQVAILGLLIVLNRKEFAQILKQIIGKLFVKH